MPVFDLFSKRQKRLRGEVKDVYEYDVISEELRIQIAHIINDVLGTNEYAYVNNSKRIFTFIVDLLCREYGFFQLPPAIFRNRDNSKDELIDFFVSFANTERALDVIEITFRVTDNTARNFNFGGKSNANEIVDGAIAELNKRFQEAGVGFQFVNQEIMRIDSQLIHQEVVKPTLKLLNSKNYKGAQEEFLSAHEHYRKGKNKEALNDCLKSFESTMKAICDKRGWTYNSTDTAQKLLQACFDNGLVPKFWQGQLTSLRSLLESSVPTGRNKLSGHGQGTNPTTIPNYLTAYMLHMTASCILFLTSAEVELP